MSAAARISVRKFDRVGCDDQTPVYGKPATVVTGGQSGLAVRSVRPT